MRRTLFIAVVFAVVTGPAKAAPSPERHVLRVALEACILAKKVTSRTFPCLAVDLGDKDRAGTAVLRAPGQPTHTVVMPTAAVSGLEAPMLQGPAGAAYWGGG
ncbi:CDP-diacylglycerol diphosphatase, partial [Methylorubrum rhodesianum]|uniref:CDP-diacylglycerol diphosphatase n=1 Tax=Methylorubrum rhodesianum TaxID=29427 RepID=UPI003D2DC12E